ncbi:BON domain-containing protein [Casimicrobium huifangae]|uniref:BON domain-containing protein n=1 Tax=Casimicrobium huifangae TaxID=2591109 RepID=UPI0037835331
MPLPSQETLSPSATRKPVAAAIVTAVVAAFTLPLLVACGEQDSTQTVGQRLDAAVARTEQTATQATESAKEAVDQARTAVLDSVDGAKQSAERVNDTLARDSDDMAITASVSAGLLKDPDLSALKIDVDTRNGVVSMYGPAPTAAAKDRATTIARAVKGVASVNNELTVKRT